MTGGKEPDLPGSFLEPTVVAGLEQDDEMIQNEIFGPVMTVQRFDDEAKAIEWANGTRYGLAASVWTRDIGRAHRVANAIRFGTVWINDHITMATEMPHGGFKQSGYGKDMSKYALEDYTIVKHVMVNLEVGVQRTRIFSPLGSWSAPANEVWDGAPGGRAVAGVVARSRARHGARARRALPDRLAEPHPVRARVRVRRAASWTRLLRCPARPPGSWRAPGIGACSSSWRDGGDLRVERADHEGDG